MSKADILPAVTTLLLGSAACAQIASHCPAQPATLREMQNCYRPLLVFAATAHDATLVAQQALLEEHAEDMLDRNLLYVPVLAKGSHFEVPLGAPYVLLEQSELNLIRDRFQIASQQFAVVLVGKDGGEKFRAKKPISVLRLDELVDAMPMGSQEKSARSAKSE